jgi:hypothetical protein
VSIPTGIAKDFGGRVHDPLQLSAICFSESAAPQQPEQFVPAGTSLALNFRDGFAMALNLDGFPAVSNPIQDSLAVIGQLCCAYYHGTKIPIFAILASLSWAYASRLKSAVAAFKLQFCR